MLAEQLAIGCLIGRLRNPGTLQCRCRLAVHRSYQECSRHRYAPPTTASQTAARRAQDQIFTIKTSVSVMEGTQLRNVLHYCRTGKGRVGVFGFQHVFQFRLRWHPRIPERMSDRSLHTRAELSCALCRSDPAAHFEFVRAKGRRACRPV